MARRPTDALDETVYSQAFEQEGAGRVIADGW